MKKKVISIISVLCLIMCLASFTTDEGNKLMRYDSIFEHATMNNKFGLISEDHELTIINATNGVDTNLLDSKSKKRYFIYNLNACNDDSPSIYNNGNVMYYDYSRERPTSVVLCLDDEELLNLSDKLIYYLDKVVEESNRQRENVVENEYFTFLCDSSYQLSYKPYGYITCYITVYKHFYTEENSLYLANFSVLFTPGTVAYKNNEEGYENYKLDSGYFHLTAKQAVEDIGPNQKRLGALPTFKDAYPSSSTGMIAITSSVDIGYTFGYSFVNGFSTSNGATVEDNKTFGTSIDFGYSKTLSTTDPIVSSQPSPEDSNKYQWNFETLTDEIASITYELNCGYIFDLDFRENQIMDEAISIRTDFEMVFYKYTLFGLRIPKETVTGFNYFLFN